MFTRRRGVDVFEWLMASLLVVVGLNILMSPVSLSVSHMRLVASWFTPGEIGALCIFVGSYRVICLSVHPINVLRFAGAVCSAVLWGEMVFAFWYRYNTIGEPLPPGFFMLSWQLIGEVWIAARVAYA